MRRLIQRLGVAPENGLANVFDLARGVLQEEGHKLSHEFLVPSHRLQQGSSDRRGVLGRPGTLRRTAPRTNPGRLQPEIHRVRAEYGLVEFGGLMGFVT